MRRFLIPAFLSVVSLLGYVTQAWWAQWWPMSIVYFLVYVLSTDKLLLELRRVPLSKGRAPLLTTLKLLIGAPTAVAFVLSIKGVIDKADLAEDAAFYVFIPFVLVWPVVIFSLFGVQDRATGSPPQSVGAEDV